MLTSALATRPFRTLAVLMALFGSLLAAGVSAPASQAATATPQAATATTGTTKSEFATSATAVKPSSAFTTMNFPVPTTGGYRTSSIKMKIISANPTTFWAEQFGLQGADGAYIGLQKDGNRSNGTVGPTAIFSVFGPSSPVAGDPCANGSDGGAGTSCIIAYTWVVGHTYRLRTAMKGDHVLSGYVKDMAAPGETLIASIDIGTGTGLTASPFLWAEDFGTSYPSCAAIPRMVVKYSALRMGGLLPTDSSDYINPSDTCPPNRPIHPTVDSVVQSWK